MIAADVLTQALTGTVVEVLPATGLADVADAQQVVWTLTRSTRCAEGLSLASQRSGQRLVLTLVSLGREQVVGHYALAAD